MHLCRERMSHALLRFFLPALGLLIFISTLSLITGSAEIRPGNLLNTLFSPLFSCFSSGNMTEEETFNTLVLYNLRLPRLAMGFLSGFGLAVAGTVMQGVTRNPLVSPFTAGVSSAAAFGASLVIALGGTAWAGGTAAVISGAFIFSILCSLTVVYLSGLRGASPETLVLAGIAMSYFFSALTSLVHFFVSQEKLMAMIHWTFGSLTSARWKETAAVALTVLTVTPILGRLAGNFDALFFTGDDTALSMGVRVKQTRIAALILSSLLTAVIICFTGIIGFIGLVGPHIARYIAGSNHRILIPASGITGAILVIAADTLGRTVLAPLILPIGIVISFAGVPLFLYLLLSRRQSAWE